MPPTTPKKKHTLTNSPPLSLSLSLSLSFPPYLILSCVGRFSYQLSWRRKFAMSRCGTKILFILYTIHNYKSVAHTQSVHNYIYLNYHSYIYNILHWVVIIGASSFINNKLSEAHKQKRVIMKVYYNMIPILVMHT